MDSILEIIVTIVVGFFWLFGNTLFNKNQENPPTTPKRKRKRDSDQTFSEVEARQREIRESIRRKIEERRQQQSESKPVVALEPEPQEVVDEPVVFAESVETNMEDPFPRILWGMFTSVKCKKGFRKLRQQSVRLKRCEAKYNQPFPTKVTFQREVQNKRTCQPLDRLSQH